MPSIRKTGRIRELEGEIVRRVELAMNARNMTGADLRERLLALTGWEAGSGMYQWFKRKMLPVGGITAALPRALGVSADWLFWGEGTMDTAPATGPMQWVRGVQYASARVNEVTASLQQEALRYDRDAQPPDADPPPVHAVRTARSLEQEVAAARAAHEGVPADGRMRGGRRRSRP